VHFQNALSPIPSMSPVYVFRNAPNSIASGGNFLPQLLIS
jgi:hypothetical protein